jgi:hypothetical protein
VTIEQNYTDLLARYGDLLARIAIDHDVLVRIDERLKQLLEKATQQESGFNAYKAETEKQLRQHEIDIQSLRTSRAQFYAVTATVSFLSSLVAIICGVLFHVFGK